MPDYAIFVNTAEAHEPQDFTFTRMRIVRAKNEAQAIKHVVADTLKVRRAEIDDAMLLASQGGKVETAKEEA